MDRAARVPVFRALLVILLLLVSFEAGAISPPVLVKDREVGADAGAAPCNLPSNRNGDCANYRWYNVCSGYVWVYSVDDNEATGILFGGPAQPCVAPGNIVKRAITYFRNVGGFGCYSSVNVYLDRDNEGDGCPDGVLASEFFFEPGLRWNCSNFGVTIPSGVSYLIVRQSPSFLNESYCCIDTWRPCPPPRTNTFVTDGPYTQTCDPVGIPRTFYYGVNMSACVPLIGPTGRHDNLLTWLIVDGGPTAVQQTSWGTIKGLYR